MSFSSQTCVHIGHRSALLLTAAAALLAWPEVLPAQDSLARAVPADVGLYAEVHGATDLLATLTEPQIWSTLAELAGQPAGVEDAAEWRRRIQQTVKMQPDEAIRVLFARGVAFVGEGPGRAQDAVVLCRPASDVSTASLLKRWGAQRVPGLRRPKTYRLYRNIGVAEHKELLLFGDLLPPRGMFRRMQKLTTDPRGKALADDPVYRGLIARVPPQADGILFARLGQAAPILVPAVPTGSQPATQSTTQPQRRALPELPGPLRNAENVLLALHREGSLLHFTAVSDGRAEGVAARNGAAARVVETLPERTLLAWAGRVDFSHLPDVVAQLPERNVLRLALNLQEHADALDRFVQALDGNVAVALGLVRPGGRAAGAPPLPAAALLLGTRDAATVGSELRTVADAFFAGYTLFALPRGGPPMQSVQETRVADVPALLLDFSPLLKASAKEAIGQVHLCWAVHENTLIIASHLDWLRQILAARKGDVQNLSNVARLSRGKLTPAVGNALVAQSGPISDVGNLWLEYLRTAKPELFDESWWRQRQPGGADVQIGIIVAVDAPNRRLRITQVSENQPADGHLRVGDFIVGFGNRRFAGDDLLSEIRTAIRQRPHARWLDLLIQRHGVTRRVRLPLPFVDPIEALRRLIAIGQIAQRCIYVDERSDAAGLRGFLTIELRTSEKPLFEFSEPVPIGAPEDVR